MAKQRRMPPAVPPRPAPARGGAATEAQIARLTAAAERAEAAEAALRETARVANSMAADMKRVIREVGAVLATTADTMVRTEVNRKMEETAVEIADLSQTIVDTFNERATEQAALLETARLQIAEVVGLGTPEKLARWLGGHLRATMYELFRAFAEHASREGITDAEREDGEKFLAGLAEAVARGGMQTHERTWADDYHALPFGRISSLPAFTDDL